MRAHSRLLYLQFSTWLLVAFQQCHKEIDNVAELLLLLSLFIWLIHKIYIFDCKDVFKFSNSFDRINKQKKKHHRPTTNKHSHFVHFCSEQRIFNINHKVVVTFSQSASLLAMIIIFIHSLNQSQPNDHYHDHCNHYQSQNGNVGKRRTD